MYLTHPCHELGLLLCLSLTLCCTHTHTHTHTHAYRHIHSLSALALLCSDTCSHSHLIIPSIYSGCACCSLSDYCVCHALNVVSPLVVNFRDLTLSCLAWSCCELLVFLGVLLLPPVSPVPRAPSRLVSPGPDLLLFCFAFFIQFCVYV